MPHSNVLRQARKLLRARRFPEVNSLLQECQLEYKESFEYHYILGVARMYLNDIGGAWQSFEQARKISVLDTRLQVAQAALFLRRCDTPRALEYYLEIQEKEPSNKIAKEAIEFIRFNDTEVIYEWVSSGKIKKFYPPLGLHPVIPKVFAVLGVCVLLSVGYGGYSLYKKSTLPPPRVDLKDFVLSVDERNNALQEDMSSDVYRYILTTRQVNDAYSLAVSNVLEYKDNAALVEINRILNSNASSLIKQNAIMLKNNLQEPTFDTIKDSYPYSKVVEDPYLYIDCWVSWTGRVANSVETDTSYSCDLLVGYQDEKRLEGIVPLVFDSAMNIDPVLPLRVLGRLGVSEGKLCMYGKSVYQPLDGSTL